MVQRKKQMAIFTNTMVTFSPRQYTKTAHPHTLDVGYYASENFFLLDSILEHKKHKALSHTRESEQNRT
jgi:hypothetical protein